MIQPNHECDQARQVISAGLDGAVSEFEQMAAARHIEGCASCGDFAGRVTRVTHAVRESEPLAVHTELVPVMTLRRRARRRTVPVLAGATAVAAAALLGAFVSSSRAPAPQQPKPLVVAYVDLKALHELHQLGVQHPLQPVGGPVRNSSLG